MHHVFYLFYMQYIVFLSFLIVILDSYKAPAFKSDSIAFLETIETVGS